MRSAERLAAGPRHGSIGQPLRRVEDARLLTGRGRFAANLVTDDCLHAAFLRSPLAHARIIDFDASAARAVEGVAAVFSAADFSHCPGVSVNQLVREVTPPDYPLLADGQVHAVGQALALIVARSRSNAEEAVEAISLDFEPLPPVMDFRPADESGESGGIRELFDAVPENICLRDSWRSGNASQALAGADHVISVTVRHPRLAPSCLEPRTILAIWDEAREGLIVHASSQTPHRLRRDLCHNLGLPSEGIRVVAQDVGGAFGMKASAYPEEILVCLAAKALRRSIFWTATRSEDFLAASHGRGARSQGKLALSREGKLLALEARVDVPLGHWMTFSAAVPAMNAGRILPGPYVLDTVDIEVQGWLTTTAPVGIYRGAGRPEAAMIMERLMDTAARRLDVDPLDFRRANLVPVDAFPHRGPTGVILDSGDYGQVLDRAADLSRYRELRTEQAGRRARGELFGIGIACYVEPCGQGWESARVSLSSAGRVRAATGSSAQGQGRETAYGQIVADVFGISPAAVEVVHGDSETCPSGIGALASRSTAIGGSALLRTAQRTLEAIKGAAAENLACRPGELVSGPEGLWIEGRKEALLSWQDIARKGSFETEGKEESDGEAWGFGCTIATVAIDRDTGQIEVGSLFCVDDAGVVINPLLAEGQVCGAVAQGLGEALMERLIYDDEGQLLTASFVDYAMPRADHMPKISVESRETPSPVNALGAKGIGEAGSIGAPAAIMNAALDAVAPLGIDHLEMPLTAETVWRAIHDRDEGSSPA